MASRPRIAVVSPFLDKRHGTERCVAEQVERLAHDYGYEVHLYSQRVEDVRLNARREPTHESGRSHRGDHSPKSPSAVPAPSTSPPEDHSSTPGPLTWHRVPEIPGPHLVRYLWWFVANHLWRWWDSRVRGLRHDLVYSPGINCLDADAISVHILFAELYRQAQPQLSLRNNSVRAFPRLIHRRLYYRLIRALERRVYTRKDLPLAVISRKTAEDLARLYGQHDHLAVTYHGVDSERFNPENRVRLRREARRALGLSGETFGVLLIGNDWKNKGLPCLLDAAARLQDPNLSVLVVGRDVPTPYQASLGQCGLKGQVHFLVPRPDVEVYYAAADTYVGPSLEDAFALPPLEAMACGLPVIVSSRAGVGEVITDGVDGLILTEPTDAETLARLIRRLCEEPEWSRCLGENAAKTVKQYTWARNAAEMHALFQETMRRKANT